MTIKQRIREYLQKQTEGIDDDELARILELKFRQQSNIYCRALEKDGLVIRKTINGKIQNFWTGPQGSLMPSEPSTAQDAHNNLNVNDWFWEGNIQAKVLVYLEAQGYHIISAADTAAGHPRGVDIVAGKVGKRLWVTVKGYPKETDKTNPKVQARHWFKQVIFDIIDFRERDKKVSLAVALPDYPQYHFMARKITWFKPVAYFSYFWVRENGEVAVE